MTQDKSKSDAQPMKFIKENGAIVLIVVVGSILLYSLTGGGPHPLDGQPAPDFTLSTLEGESVTLASHAGKDVVVLDFWASWCPPCRKGLPVVDTIAKRFDGRPVAVYAVNIREGESLVSDFVQKLGLSLPVLLDDRGLVADDFAVTGIPQTVIIGKDGIVHAVHVGMSPFGFEEELASDIEAALAGDSPASEPGA